MAKASPIQTSFNAGVFSDVLDGHIDAPRRASALKTCQNMIPLKQGPVTRRGGTRFVEFTKNNGQALLVRFEFNVEQAYMLEFGDGYIRFYKDHGLILEADVGIEGATQANPVVIASTAHPYSDGDEIFINGVAGMIELNNRRFFVSNKATNTFELANEDGTSHTAYTSGGRCNRIFEIASPYASANLFDGNLVPQLSFTQSADVLYLVHEDFQPRVLTRMSDTDWAINVLVLEDGPYLAQNTEDNKITPNGTTGNITLTADDADTFVAGDVNRLVRIRQNSKWGYAQITAFVSGTQVSATVKRNFQNTTGTDDWRLGVYSDGRGWPSAVTFYQNRFSLAGAPTNPQRVDLSRTGDFDDEAVNFEPSNPKTGTVRDDDAVSFTLNANDVNSINWMIDDERAMVIGTVGGEWTLSASTLGQALTPTNVKADRATREGTSKAQAIRATNSVLFVQRARRKLHEFAFQFEADGFRSPDMTILAADIADDSTSAEPGFVALAYQAQPHNILWCSKADGTLAGFTYERAENVLAWHLHEIGGNDDLADTRPGFIESISVIPSPDTSRDELYMIVRRNIDGDVKRYVEFMEDTYKSTTPQKDAFHVDSGLTYDDVATTTISGLDHLEGEEVEIYADGAFHPRVTVVDGTISLVEAKSTVQIGFPNTWRIETLNLEAGALDGSAQSKKKSFQEVFIRLWNTQGIRYGPDGQGNMLEDPIEYGTVMGQATSLFTDDLRVQWPRKWERAGRLRLEHDRAGPATVQAIMPRVVTSDK